jgi:hypothetical protein
MRSFRKDLKDPESDRFCSNLSAVSTQPYSSFKASIVVLWGELLRLRPFPSIGGTARWKATCETVCAVRTYPTRLFQRDRTAR